MKRNAASQEKGIVNVRRYCVILKRIICIASCFCFGILIHAHALTITIDLDKASEQELMDVKALIENKLEEFGHEADKEAPTATDEVTLEHAENTVEIIRELRSMLKNRQSLQIHSITFYDGDGRAYQYWWVIDASAQNGFGGMNRELYYGTCIELGSMMYIITDSDSNLYSYLEKQYEGVLGQKLDVDYILSII